MKQILLIIFSLVALQLSARERIWLNEAWSFKKGDYEQITDILSYKRLSKHMLPTETVILSAKSKGLKGSDIKVTVNK